jgi:hypothetical protein
MKIIAIGMMALAISCGSTTTRQAGDQQGGQTVVGKVQLEDFEFAMSKLIVALSDSGVLSSDTTVFFLKDGTHTPIAGVDNKSTTPMDHNGMKISLCNYLMNDLYKRDMCELVATAKGYDRAKYGLKVLIVNEAVTGERKIIGKADESNRIVMTFELYDLESESIAFISSEVVQKNSQ